MTFSLDKNQINTLSEWLKEQDEKAVAVQKQSVEESNPFYSTYKQYWDDGHPYLGAIGGGCTYQFTPTHLGTVVKVYYCKGTDMEAMVDLTDYDNW